MKNTKGFTLIELMVTVLIVIILAAVAIPILRGRIDAAKWSEGKAGAGTIAVALRAYSAEGRDPNGFTTPSQVGFAAGDLDGTYFLDDCYSFTVEGLYSYTISVDATQGRTTCPTADPTTRTLTVVNGNGTWSNP